MDGSGQEVAEVSAIGLARRLNDLLAERRWKPAHLAEKAGLAASWVPEYLAGGVGKPRLATLEKLAAAFDLGLDEFLSTIPVEGISIQVTQDEADVLRVLAAIHKSSVEEVVIKALVDFIQKARSDAVLDAVQAIRAAREPPDVGGRGKP